MAELMQTEWGDEMVSAMTFANPDQDSPSHEVKGRVMAKYIPTLDYYQYLIGGELVDPKTIKALDV